MSNAMGNNLIPLAEEAAQLEHNISRLYVLFHKAFSEDADFWWKLAIEENNHASLFRSGIDYFIPAGIFPNEILHSMLEELQEVNQMLLSLHDKYKTSTPTREIAFNLALEIERSAGEIHFQRAITKSTDSKILKIFQKLNKDDKDHETRIQVYMKENGIPESSP
jgi:hypothetical protein